ncbi:aminotransferase [Trametes punicea]|nr:aminotransferase [Trametes punicea]
MSPNPGFDLISTTRYGPRLRDIDWNTSANANTPSPYLLLRYHYERLRDALQVHGWPVPQGFSPSILEDYCNIAVKGAENEASGADHNISDRSFRIRILLSYSGSFSVTASPTVPLPSHDPAALSLWLPSSSSSPDPPLPSDLLVVHLDNQPTPSSIFTRTKTTRRDHYTAARNRFSIPPLPSASSHEVLLFNENGEITEASIRNVALVRRSPLRWVTPSSSTGCLPGVMRRWLLEQGRIVEANEGELRQDDILDGEFILTFNGLEGCRLGRVKVGCEEQ